MNTKLDITLLCFFLTCLSCLGCGSSTAVKISFDVSPIVKDETGKVSIKGQSGSGQIKKPASAAGTTITVTPQGKYVSVKVVKADSSTIQFEISHPDHPNEGLELSTGETKDVFPGGGNSGVRIAVKP